MERSSDINFKIVIKTIKFSHDKNGKNIVAKLSCKLFGHNQVFIFTNVAFYDSMRKIWSINSNQVDWQQSIPDYLVDPKNIRSINSELSKIFNAYWLKGDNTIGTKGSIITSGRSRITKQLLEEANIIIRPYLFFLYKPDWKFLWDSILNRARFDPEFAVGGFRKEEVIDSLNYLKNIFPYDWVKRQFRRSLPSEIDAPTIWQNADKKIVFPAFLLSGVALGITCKEPTLNFLVSLGNSVPIVKKFREGKRLLNNLARSEGSIHQCLVANYFYNRGILADINQPIGAGRYRHDFQVKIDCKNYDIEMKALTTDNPSRRLRTEICKRTKQLPLKPSNPVVYFVLLFDYARVLEKNEVDYFTKSITEDCFCESSRISAIVVGESFVDSGGGIVKWQFYKFLPNPRARNKISRKELRKIFSHNWRKITYPIYPITFILNIRRNLGN